MTVSGVKAQEEAARAAVKAATNEEERAAAVATAQETRKKRKLVVKARNDQSTGGKSPHWFVSVSCVDAIRSFRHWATIYTWVS